MELERFIQRWTFPAYPPEGVLPSDLDAAEHQLGVHFPLEYRDAILQAGLPRPTIALLNSIVDQDLDLRDVSEFFHRPKYWRRPSAHEKRECRRS